jgi:hypothetical protein
MEFVKRRRASAEDNGRGPERKQNIKYDSQLVAMN